MNNLIISPHAVYIGLNSSAILPCIQEVLDSINSLNSLSNKFNIYFLGLDNENRCKLFETVLFFKAKHLLDQIKYISFKDEESDEKNNNDLQSGSTIIISETDRFLLDFIQSLPEIENIIFLGSVQGEILNLPKLKVVNNWELVLGLLSWMYC